MLKNLILKSLRGDSLSLILRWRRGFHKDFEKRFEQAQKYVDEECVKLMDPYVPVAKKSYRNAGKLKKSVRISSPGLIEYTAPFAEHDYYANVNHAHGGNPNAKRLWFEVMKAEKKQQILRGAAVIMGGKAR